MDVISFDTVIGIGGMAVVVALVELTKRTIPTIPNQFYPLIALIWSLCLNVGVALYRHTDIGLAVVVGVVVALMASGLYSGTRTVAKV